MNSYTYLHVMTWNCLDKCHQLPHDHVHDCIVQTCAATSPNSLEIYFRTGWWYLQTGSGLISGEKIKKKSKMAVLGLSGHLLSRYIVHLGLKNTPGLIFEVPGPQNPLKKLI